MTTMQAIFSPYEMGFFLFVDRYRKLLTRIYLRFLRLGRDWANALRMSMADPDPIAPPGGEHFSIRDLVHGTNELRRDDKPYSRLDLSGAIPHWGFLELRHFLGLTPRCSPAERHFRAFMVQSALRYFQHCGHDNGAVAMAIHFEGELMEQARHDMQPFPRQSRAA